MRLGMTPNKVLTVRQDLPDVSAYSRYMERHIDPEIRLTFFVEEEVHKVVFCRMFKVSAFMNRIASSYTKKKEKKYSRLH